MQHLDEVIKEPIININKYWKEITAAS